MGKYYAVSLLEAALLQAVSRQTTPDQSGRGVVSGRAAALRARPDIGWPGSLV